LSVKSVANLQVPGELHELADEPLIDALRTEEQPLQDSL